MAKRYPAFEPIFKTWLDAFLFDCQVRNLTPKTISVYTERLGYFFKYLKSEGVKPTDVTKQTIHDYIVSMQGVVSDETINGRIRSIKRLYNFLESEEMLTGKNPAATVKQLKVAKTIKPVIAPDCLQKIISSINLKKFEGVRNRLMLLLFWDCMLRRQELVGLKIGDIDLNNRLLRIHGKGRKDRMVPIGIKTLKLLHKYLVAHRSKYPGEHLICMRNGLPLTETRCYRIIHYIGKGHGVKMYPHLLRHSAATWYIRQGGNPAVLQGILGHTSLLVTQNYLHLSSQDAVNSYDQFSPSNCLRV